MKQYKKTGISHHETIRDYAMANPNFYLVFEGAKLLFDGISDIHSNEGLEIISSRYIENKEKLETIGPER